MAWFERDDISLSYELGGRGGRTLVLCHELGGSLDSWAEVVRLLEGEFRILRWDQRGAGRSEKPVQPYPIARHAEDLSALVDQLGLAPPYTMVGAAAGAAVALLFAQARPESVAAAVLCAPSLGVDPTRRGYLLDRSAKAARLGMRGIVDVSLGQSYPPEAITAEATYRDYRARFLGNDPVSYGLANAALADFEAGDLLSRIGFPVVLLAGVHDRLRPPAYVEGLARQIRGATVTRVESGHLMPVQAPEVVAKAIRDLRGSPAEA